MAATYTCKEAAKRHQGVTAKKFQIMCLRGEIRAKKFGRDWHIPEEELDRVFSPQEVISGKRRTRRASR